MKRLLTISSILFVAFVALGATADYYLKINRSFDLFSSVVRNISENYVLETDPEEIVNTAIQSMLSQLDPYSVYYQEEENDEIQVATTGNYVGLGITVGTIESDLTITGLQEGYPAEKEGIRIGDKLFRIDNDNVMKLQSSELRNYTRGLPGSIAKVDILREGRDDTLSFNIQRSEIKLKNVTYYGLLGDSTGYIMISRFSRNAADELRRAVNELIANHNIKNLILDFRGNPGGLLDQAVRISEMFLQKDLPIVSTKGRAGFKDYTYKSMTEPDFPNIPLAVLIDEYSASASEVVAGAIQDHDRGVIIGRQSFGKGLVQSVFDLPHKSSIKITTAKYYTPSGRCIQRIEYDKAKSKEVKLDSVFYTKNGRPVKENKGISPDQIVVEEEISEFVSQMINSFSFFRFATKYTAKLNKVDENFVANDQVLNEFKSFLKEIKYFNTKLEMKLLNDIESQSKKNNYSDETLSNIIILEQAILNENLKQFDLHREKIAEVLTFEIKRRLLPETKMIESTLGDDKIIIQAVRLLNIHNEYQRILVKTIDDNSDY